MNKKDVKRGMLPYLLLIVIALGIYYMLSIGSMKVNDLTYDIFLSEIKNGIIQAPFIRKIHLQSKPAVQPGSVPE